MNFLNFDNDKPKKLPTDKAQIISYHHQYNNIKIGQFVRVHYLQGSSLNDFKGYIGEIRDYKQGQEHALVTLHALNTQRPIKMNIQHFHLIQ
jgi:hypothetical protein